MIIRKKKITRLKPIEIDAHFRYECPDKGCRCDHWLSLKEAQTPNFKIVCDCGLVLRPKLIQKIKILYKKKPAKHESQKQSVEPTKPEIINNKRSLPTALKEESAKKLMYYGFTKEESELLCEKAFNLNETGQSSVLIKYILENIKTLESTK